MLPMVVLRRDGRGRRRGLYIDGWVRCVHRQRHGQLTELTVRCSKPLLVSPSVAPRLAVVVVLPRAHLCGRGLQQHDEQHEDETLPRHVTTVTGLRHPASTHYHVHGKS